MRNKNIGTLIFGWSFRWNACPRKRGALEAVSLRGLCRRRHASSRPCPSKARPFNGAPPFGNAVFDGRRVEHERLVYSRFSAAITDGARDRRTGGLCFTLTFSRYFAPRSDRPVISVPTRPGARPLGCPRGSPRSKRRGVAATLRGPHWCGGRGVLARLD